MATQENEKGFFYTSQLEMSLEERNIQLEGVNENLKEINNQFKLTIEEAPVPIMLHAEDGEVLSISKIWTEITGYTLQEIPTTKKWAEKAYGPQAKEGYQMMESLYMNHERQHDGEFTIHTKTGGVCLWDFYSFTIGKLGDGRNQAISIAVDVTNKRKLEAALFNEKKFLEITLLSVGDGIISCDKRGNVLLMNKVAEYLTGWNLAEAKGKNIEEVLKVVNELTRDHHENMVQKIVESKKASEIGEGSLLISKLGKEIPIEGSVASILDEEEKLNGIVLVFRDFTSKVEKQKQIEYLSYHDPLTNLYNRRFYEEELSRLDTERNLPLSIIMGDVNGLKLINDSFGHKMGDDLLKKVSEAIKMGCRGGEIIARYGGDEFVVLLPKTVQAEAEKIIERIKEITASQKLEPVEVSISFGCGTKTVKEEHVEEIFKKAEDHMYQQKLFESQLSKNRTINAIIGTLKEKVSNEEFQTERIAELCAIMGTAIGLNEHKIAVLKKMAMLHDIGKIAIEDYIFNKPDKLTEDEREEVNRHPEVGYRILSTVNDTAEMAEYVLYHHEKWNGTGYPKGLKAEEIPIESRILSIIDAYEAMASARSYREPLAQQEILKELEKNAGTQFDPDLVYIFIKKILGKEN